MIDRRSGILTRPTPAMPAAPPGHGADPSEASVEDPATAGGRVGAALAGAA